MSASNLGNDDLSAVLAAALERATAGPFDPDGTLSPAARAEVQAILDQAGGDLAVPFAEGPPATRHTDAMFSDDEMLRMFSSYWTPCRSSHVAQVRYHADKEQLHLQFEDGTRGYYPSISADLAEDFGNAPSKGGWIWDVMRENDWPWVLD